MCMCEVSPETQHPCYSSFKHQYPSKQQCSVSTVFAVHSSMTSHKSQCTDIALNSALNSAQFPSLDVPSTAQKMCQAPLISTLISKHARKYYTYISGTDCVLYQNARASYISIVGQAILNCLSHYGNIWVYFREATTDMRGNISRICPLGYAVVTSSNKPFSIIHNVDTILTSKETFKM